MSDIDNLSKLIKVKNFIESLEIEDQDIKFIIKVLNDEISYIERNIHIQIGKQKLAEMRANGKVELPNERFSWKIMRY